MPGDSRAPRAGVVREVLLVLVVFALAGVVAGFLWYWWWSPAPEGVVFAGEPFFDPDQEFRSTGMFVVIAVPLGLLLSMVLTFWLDRDEVATLFAVLAGACLATVLMAVVGDALGPESAREVAAGRADLEPVAADLRVQPFAPYLALPGSAVVGATSILLSFHNRRLSAEPSGYAPRRT